MTLSIQRERQAVSTSGLRIMRPTVPNWRRTTASSQARRDTRTRFKEGLSYQAALRTTAVKVSCGRGLCHLLRMMGGFWSFWGGVVGGRVCYIILFLGIVVLS